MLKAIPITLFLSFFLIVPRSGVVFGEIENVTAISSSLPPQSVPAAPDNLQFGEAGVPSSDAPVSLPDTVEFLMEGPLSAAASKGGGKGQGKELVGYWSFDDTNGSTVLDGSKFDNVGVLTSASLGEGRFGQGLILDGTGGLTVLNSASLNSLPGGFTLSAWIYSTSYPDFTTIFWKTDRHNLIHQLHFQVDGRLHAAMNQVEPEGGFQGFSSFVVPLNEWHYVAWTYDEKFHRFYNDGTEVFKAAFTDPWVGNAVDLLIGYHPEISSANFRGIIDEARIYRGALTAAQIKKDMNRGVLSATSFELTSQSAGVGGASSIVGLLGNYYAVWSVSEGCDEDSDDLTDCGKKRKRRVLT